jgi:1,4-alpha-glucan branching enzyme
MGTAACPLSYTAPKFTFTLFLLRHVLSLPQLFFSVRKCSSGKNNLLFVLNMTPMKWENYTVPVPKKKKYKLLLNSDEERFGGWGNKIPTEITAEKKPYHYKDYSISFDLPPYGAAVFLF